MLLSAIRATFSEQYAPLAAPESDERTRKPPGMWTASPLIDPLVAGVHMNHVRPPTTAEIRPEDIEVSEVDDFHDSQNDSSVGTHRYLGLRVDRGHQSALYFGAPTWSQMIHLIARDRRGGHNILKNAFPHKEITIDSAIQPPPPTSASASGCGLTFDPTQKTLMTPRPHKSFIFEHLLARYDVGYLL